MILLDTHIWIWWADGSERLTSVQRTAIADSNGVGISAISCWEVAKLVERGRLGFDRSLQEWMKAALRLDGLSLLPLSPEVAVASTCLPGEFHKDPADQIIVATARIYNLPLLTSDSRLLAYPHVENAVSP